VVGYDGIQFFPMGFGTVTPVNDLAFYNGRIYAACDVVSGNDTCALALFNASNNEWEKVIFPINNLGNSFTGDKICALAVNGNEMLCGGNFMVGAGLFFGNNMMRFQQANAATANDYTIAPVLYLDSTVNTIAMNNSIAYFGGEFVANNMSNVLNHVAFFDVLTGIKEQTKNEGTTLSIYPNPANESCILQFSASFGEKDYLVISNSLGQEISHINLPKGAIQFPIELAGLANGIYQINVYNSDKIYHQKLIVKK
jgi:hypothetical protein